MYYQKNRTHTTHTNTTYTQTPADNLLVVVVVFIVVFGIMAVFSALDEEKKEFYDYHVENGSGYCCKVMYEEGRLKLQQCRMLEKHKF